MHESFANLFPESLHFPPYSLLWRRRRLFRVLLLLAGASARRSSSHSPYFLFPPRIRPLFYVSSSYRFAFCVRGVDVSVFSGKWKWKVCRVRSFTAAACEQVRSLIPSKWISFKPNDDVWQCYLWLETMMMRSEKEVAEKNQVSHHHRYCKWWMQWNIFSFRKESTFLSLLCSTLPIDQVGEAR